MFMSPLDQPISADSIANSSTAFILYLVTFEIQYP